MKYIVGIDEVGRGPLAGPVTVCVVACEENLYKKLKRDKSLPPPGKDSKKLSPELRQKYAKNITKIIQGMPLDKFSCVIINVSNKVIDKKGISFAISGAIEKGLRNLKIKIVFENLCVAALTQGRGVDRSVDFGGPTKTSALKILLDGGLRAPKEFINQKTIIKGDEKEKIISWASILAKVSRDNLMCRLAKKYPKYGFEIHKGYGTEKHRKAIKRWGLSGVHRKSFCRRYDY